MPENPLNGFAGNTAVLTTWGACLLHDLARLNASRSAAAQTWLVRIAEMQARHAAAVDAFNADIAPLLPEADATVQLTALLAAHASELAAFTNARDENLADRMPLLVVDADTTAEIVDIVRVGETVDVFDVTISTVEIGDPPTLVPIKVRCGAAALFTTASNGDTAAAALDGVSINIYPDATFLASATSQQLSEPVALYRVTCAAATYCVGADSTVAAHVVSAV